MNTEALDKESKFDADVIVLACKAPRAPAPPRNLHGCPMLSGCPFVGPARPGKWSAALRCVSRGVELTLLPRGRKQCDMCFFIICAAGNRVVDLGAAASEWCRCIWHSPIHCDVLGKGPAIGWLVQHRCSHPGFLPQLSKMLRQKRGSSIASWSRSPGSSSTGQPIHLASTAGSSRQFFPTCM